MAGRQDEGLSLDEQERVKEGKSRPRPRTKQWIGWSQRKCLLGNSRAESWPEG